MGWWQVVVNEASSFQKYAATIFNKLRYDVSDEIRGVYVLGYKSVNGDEYPFADENGNQKVDQIYNSSRMKTVDYTAAGAVTKIVEFADGALLHQACIVADKADAVIIGIYIVDGTPNTIRTLAASSAVARLEFPGLAGSTVEQSAAPAIIPPGYRLLFYTSGGTVADIDYAYSYSELPSP